jgi:uncharacterized protein YjbI with pentapeptide repeats
LANGAPLDFVRGVTLTRQLLAELLDQAPTAQDGRRRIFRNADFRSAVLDQVAFKQACFTGDANFSRAHFQGHADFEGARFEGSADFQRAHFDSRADFGATSFLGSATFSFVRFQGGAADFMNAHFQETAGFDGSHFEGYAYFSRASFQGPAYFDGADFQGPAYFDDTRFEKTTTFHDANFKASAELFQGASFEDYLGFRDVRFEITLRFGPLVAADKLVLDDATFARSILIEVATPLLSCARTRFEGGGTLRTRYAYLILDGAAFPQPMTISSGDKRFAYRKYNVRPLVEVKEDILHGKESSLDKAYVSVELTPQVVSMRGVDVSNLVITDMHLGSCLFAGTHHLDRLRIEGPNAFTDTPHGWKVGWAWPPVWRWTRRQVLAEEHHWRLDSPRGGKRAGWRAFDDRLSELIDQHTGQAVTVIGPERITSLYRQLRKAQEDSKNEPGAADFYYGEMEMRRYAPSTPLPERWILHLYWLVSGYSLRGLRALTCLTVVIVGLAFMLQAAGFDGGDPSFRDALIYAAQSTLSIASGNKALTEHVTWVGEVLRIALRLVGPLLLGLALLSVRNRVKR